MRRLLLRAQKVLRVLRRREYRRALRHGVAASVEHEAIPFRDDFATVIDVGANRGQFAVFALRSFPLARVICFEPLPAALARVALASGHDPRVSVSQFAIGPRYEEALLHVSRADDSSSLLPIGRRQSEAFPGTAERSTITVSVRPLDDVVDPGQLVRPVLMKVDVQGGELGVLKGGPVTLGSVDALVVEASFVELYTGQPLVDDLFEHIRGHGFRCLGIWSLTYDKNGECLQGDFLFARNGFDPLSR